MKTYYTILGISENASSKEIKTAYKAGYNVVGVFDKHSSKNKDEDIRKHSMLFIRNFK